MVSVRAGAALGCALLFGVAWLVRGPGFSVDRDPAVAQWSSTTRADLERIGARARERLKQDPLDAPAAVMLSEALLRQSRVEGDAALVVHAEQALRRVLSRQPADYEARRMLATVLLSQHRFRDAIATATSLRAERGADHRVDGIIGDGHLELGEYDEAFAAFDRMMATRPTAAAYARVSYARELQGDRSGARELMAMAREATPASDAESLAWHDVQLGTLALDDGDAAAASRFFDRAEYVFPSYAPAADGRVRVLVALGRFAEALTLARSRLEEQSSPELVIVVGDLEQLLGRREDADRAFAEAEHLLRYEPAALARLLADRDRDLVRALSIARRADQERQDIYTADALAWALYKNGRKSEALAAATRALRTGTADRHILAHAAAIYLANGREAAASRLVQRSVGGHRRFDVIGSREATATLQETVRRPAS